MIYTIDQLVLTKESLSVEMDDRKRIQKQLEMILSLLSDTEEGIFILDENFNSMYVNQTFIRIINVSEKDVKNKNFL